MNKAIAIMQPYFFPYLGYFQLLQAVDKLIILDDVNYIKQGWINKNKLMLKEQEYTFTIPLKNSSSNVHISDTFVSEKHIIWKSKFIKTIKQNFSSSVQTNKIIELIEEIFDTNNKTISNIATSSLVQVCKYLNVDLTYSLSSKEHPSPLKSSERIIDICKKEKATQYINLPGGYSLYDTKLFRSEGIELKFIDYQRTSSLLGSNSHYSVLNSILKLGPIKTCHFIKNYYLC